MTDINLKRERKIPVGNVRLGLCEQVHNLALASR